MIQHEDFKVVDDLKPGVRGVNIKIRCISKYEEREVISRKTGEFFRVTEALVGDETGCILLTLWNKDIAKVQIEKIYKLTNVYTSVFRNSLRLNIGKYGNLEEINEDIPMKVNEKNNLSDRIYEQKRRRRSRYDVNRRQYKDNIRGYSHRRPRRSY